MKIIGTASDICVNYTPDPKRLANFRFWHVESLLNQASDLLDRCIKDRSEYNNLRSQWEIMRLQIEKAERDFAIADERIASGGLERTLKSLRLDKKLNMNLFRLSSEGQDLFFNEPDWDTPTSMSAKTQKDLGVHDWTLRMQQPMLLSQPDGIDERISWEIKNIDFQKRETESGRQALLKQREAMNDADGPLNFPKYVAILRDRIERDLTDALDRLFVAMEGMKTLYGYSSPDTPQRAADSTLGVLDAAINWVREAIKWLVAFGQIDQAATFSFSIRALAATAWPTAIANAMKTGEAHFSFNLGTVLFESHSYVRLRGLSAFVAGRFPSSTPWVVEAQVPRTAISVRKRPNGSREDFTFDQTQLPVCRLGRVDTRICTRQPECAGLISLMNASPIGEDHTDGRWSLTLRPQADSSDFAALDDLHLELSIVGQPN